MHIKSKIFCVFKQKIQVFDNIFIYEMKKLDI
jgi:hypothetical protein